MPTYTIRSTRHAPGRSTTFQTQAFEAAHNDAAIGYARALPDGSAVADATGLTLIGSIGLIVWQLSRAGEGTGRGALSFPLVAEG